MIEVLLAGGLLAAIIVAIGGRSEVASGTATIVPVSPVPADDLPCPWCGADTREDDAHCPSCRQRFG